MTHAKAQQHCTIDTSQAAIGTTTCLVKGKEELTAADEDLVRAVLVAELGRVALAGLKLDGDLLLVEQVGALKDDAEAALANLLADAVVDTHHVGRGAATGHGERASPDGGVRVTDCFRLGESSGVSAARG
jgi:hypothetical protein